MALHLTSRLQTVADRVPAGVRLTDVGTDHAYLPAWLLMEGKIPFAVCTDLRPGPLERAKETVEHYGVADKVSLRLCDGLSGVEPQEVDCIAIAGMGGETILHILEAAPWSVEKSCIVQPMSSLPDLRAGVGRLGLRIIRETLAREGETLYVVMELQAGAEGLLTAAERLVGRVENHLNDPLWPRYLQQEAARTRRALEGLARSKRPEDELRKQELQNALTGIQDMMEAI